MSVIKTRNVMDEKVRASGERLARIIDGVIRPNHGFCLFIFEFGEPDGEKQLSYISSAQRDDVIAMIKDWIAVQEGRAHDQPESTQ